MKQITIKCNGFLIPVEPETPVKKFPDTDFELVHNTDNPFACKIKNICELNDIELNEDTLFHWFRFCNEQCENFALYGLMVENSIIFPFAISQCFPSEIFEGKKEGDVVILKQYARTHEIGYKGSPDDDEGETAEITLEVTLKQNGSEFDYESFEALYSDLLKHYELGKKIHGIIWNNKS